jgi:4-hydroxybenzoate polyprenyltransferase
MVAARNAAMAFNRWTDRDIDAMNKRTAAREIPAGIIKPASALAFVVANAAVFSWSAYMINPLCFLLSPVAVFVVLFYSYTKRFTALCHFVLGAGLGLAPIGSYIAVTAAFSLAPVLVSLAVFFWVAGFDILYSLQDEDFDRSNKLRSIPSLLGRKNSLALSRLSHAASLILLVLSGLFFAPGPIYWAGLAIFSALIAYQQSIVKIDDISKLGIAFGTANGIASVLFSAMAIVSIALRDGWLKL